MATVLCADDDRNLCRILEKALVGAGHRVVVAHDGEQALALAGEGSPDLAIVDIALPRVDGFGVAEGLRRRPAPLGQIPILLTSAFRVTPKYERRAEELGVAAILPKPVPLDHLLQVVASHLKGEAPPAQQSSRRRPLRGGKGPRLAGTLEELAFPQLIHELHGLRASGVLLLASNRKRKAIQFREGYPVAVKSNLVGECLGNFLVRQGALTKTQLQESLKRMKRGEGLQGQILVAMEVASGEQISRAIKQQAAEKLFEIFRWKQGRFKFEIGTRLKGGNALALEGSPANLILRGVRDHVPLERVDAWLKEYAQHFVERSPSPFYRFQEIDLRGEERALLDDSGGRRLRDLARGGEGVRRALYAMLVTGMLQLQERSGAAERRPRSKRTRLPDARRQARAAQVRHAPEPERPRASSEPAARAESPGAPTPEAERALRIELAGMAERLRGQTYFQMLGLDPEAPANAVRRVYEDLAGRTHPDRFQGSSESVRQLAQEVFDLLTRAHDTLVDPRRRGEYQIRLLKGKRSEAERRAAELALDAEVSFQKGEAKLRARDYEGALVRFGEALQRGSEEGEYHAHYGWALYLCHPDEPDMLQEAIEHVRRGVKLARDREKPYLFLGRLYKAVGRPAAAEKMFTRAVQIRPDSIEGLRELRLINMRRGKGKGWIGRLLKR